MGKVQTVWVDILKPAKRKKPTKAEVMAYRQPTDWSAPLSFIAIWLIFWFSHSVVNNISHGYISKKDALAEKKRLADEAHAKKVEKYNSLRPAQIVHTYEVQWELVEFWNWPASFQKFNTNSLSIWK